MIISPAYAQAAPAGDPGFIGFLPIILMFVLLYFLMIRQQMKRAKEHKQMVEALQKGDEVVAAGGIVGRISELGEAYLTLPRVGHGLVRGISHTTALLLIVRGSQVTSADCSLRSATGSRAFCRGVIPEWTMTRATGSAT